MSHPCRLPNRAQLVYIGTEAGRVPVGVLGVLKTGSRAKLEAFTKFSSEEEGAFDYQALRSTVVKRSAIVLKKGREKMEVEEEEFGRRSIDWGPDTCTRSHSHGKRRRTAIGEPK